MLHRLCACAQSTILIAFQSANKMESPAINRHFPTDTCMSGGGARSIEMWQCELTKFVQPTTACHYPHLYIQSFTIFALASVIVLSTNRPINRPTSQLPAHPSLFSIRFCHPCDLIHWSETIVSHSFIHTMRNYAVECVFNFQSHEIHKMHLTHSATRCYVIFYIFTQYKTVTALHCACHVRSRDLLIEKYFVCG